MNKQFQQTILKATQSDSLEKLEVIQELWSGYGAIVRYGLKGGNIPSVVVKFVQLPDKGNHPKGWNSTLSHERKVKSYKVETEWYKSYVSIGQDFARMPECLAYDECGDEVLIVLEDLDAAGYPSRLHSVDLTQVKVCLKWLANFHAAYLGYSSEGLWEVGTYWHLETRPDELDVLDDLSLKKVAAKIDHELNNANFQTIVHGDAKLANFCFSKNGESVAAVDFQYVGGGCGMKDVAYFIGSCMSENDCDLYESELLAYYFQVLEESCSKKGFNSFEALKEEWSKLYCFAWADFHRFLKGWSPGHWKINSYSERITKKVIEELR